MAEQIQPDDLSDAVVRRLKRERNWFATGAVVMIAIAIAVALPRRVQRYRVHKGLNSELLDLQAQIGTLQRTIAETEKNITAAQLEIRNLQTSAR